MAWFSDISTEVKHQKAIKANDVVKEVKAVTKVSSNGRDGEVITSVDKWKQINVYICCTIQYYE